MSLPPTHPDQPEEHLPPFDLASVPSDAEDEIPQDEVLPAPEPNPAMPDVVLPRIVLGCAPFGYGIYADRDNVTSTMPVRLVRAALRAGVNAFDTSPHYHPSETILGNALAALRGEFPRSSYSIITKAGKYGPHVRDHKYEPDVVRRSVERSLRRLQTDYLDVVYLHDVEFVASAPFPCPAGAHLDALTPEGAATYHLTPPYVSLGAGDDAIVASLLELRALQAEGKIRRVGLAGYPLPVLLRLSLLVLAVTGVPVDVVQSYAHQTVLCATMDAFTRRLTEDAKVAQVVNAAPLSMGILTRGGGPEWHPAKRLEKLYGATREAVTLAQEAGSSIEAVAIAFGYRTLLQPNGAVVPVVVGCTDLNQLHQTLKSYKAVNGGEEDAVRDEAERRVTELFKERGVYNVSWQSPAPEAMV